ncbi:putative PEP-CTERM exosortase interaction domain-containing protein [Rubrivivax sp. A210]|uniref:NF038132 family protein n=1 Tax=Rubrivivax sp. A210 TaxID=2772301 RepID=UPI001919F5C7|nr:NF038132 family protein [Rubrivivax sp. A210]CAD5371365.1 putative PEP-CTERM exosortase interaction domain-containing protein [Rubrivivax sp. A210]
MYSILRLGKALAVAALLPTAALAVAVTPPANLATWTCVGACGVDGVDSSVGLSPIAGHSSYGYVTTFGSSATGVSSITADSGGNLAAAETNGSKWTSGAFTAQAGQTLDVFLNYITSDGSGYADYGWARVIRVVGSTESTAAWMFTARSSQKGSSGIIPGGLVGRDFDPRATLVGFKDWNMQLAPMVSFFDTLTNTTIFSKTDMVSPLWSQLGSFDTSFCYEGANCGQTGWLNSHLVLGAGTYKLEVGVTNFGDEAYNSGLAFDYAGVVTTTVPEPSALAMALAGLAAFGLGGMRRRKPVAAQA